MRRITPINLPSRRQLTRPGFAGWWMLLLACAAIFFSGPGLTYGTASFVDPMIEELAMSRSLFSLLYSTGTLIGAATLMIVGQQIDRRGYRLVLVLGAIGLALGIIALGLAGGPILVLIGFSLSRACGQGLLGLSARTLVPQWFVRQRGRAFSILGLSGTFSLALFPPVHERMISWIGWRNAWFADAAFLLMVLTPLFFLFVRNRPEDIGQHPDGRRPTDDDAFVAASADAESGMTLRQAFRTTAFWGLVLATVAPSIAVTGISFNQIAILSDKGLPSSAAATTFTVESLAALPATLAMGWLIDRFAARYLLVAAQVTMGLAIVALLFVDGIELAIAHAALRGVAGVFWMIGGDVAWPQYYGRKHLGSIRGFAFAVSVSGSALGPLPLGVAFDTFGTYDPAIVALLVVSIIAALAVWFARPPVLSMPVAQ